MKWLCQPVLDNSLTTHPQSMLQIMDRCHKQQVAAIQHKWPCQPDLDDSLTTHPQSMTSQWSLCRCTCTRR